MEYIARPNVGDDAGIAPPITSRLYEQNYGGVVMHKTILIEKITLENVTEKINEKVQEMEKDGYQIKTMSFWGTDKAVLIFKKGLKGSLL